MSLQLLDTEVCPCCGEAGIKLKTDRGWVAEKVLVECPSCGMRTPWFQCSKYDRERFDHDGPQSKYGGAYYDLPWREDWDAFRAKRAS